MRSIAQSIAPSYPWYQFMLSDTMKHLIAGGMAGAVSRTVVNPMERMKILFQVKTGKIHNHMLSCANFFLHTPYV
jgi:solute carrier family 25 phosphate transporter 23/24/25/41